MTERQIQLLKTIIETYAQTAEPVGSLAIANLLGYSPATIRSEMAELERQGLITHPHTSAGRIPTDKGYRLYVNTIQPEASKRSAAVIGRQIRGSGEAEQAIKNTANSLAQATHNLGIATWLDHIHRFGLSQLFSHPEFQTQTQLFEIAQLLDYLPEYLQEIFPDANRVSILIGSENPIGKAAGATSIIGRVRTPYGQSFIGVIGPTRQNYVEVVGLVDYAARQLEEAINV